MADFLKSLLRGVLGIVAPIAVTAVGVGLAFLGMELDLPFLFWAGLAIAAIGAVWFAILCLFVQGGSPFD